MDHNMLIKKKRKAFTKRKLKKGAHSRQTMHQTKLKL